MDLSNLRAIHEKNQSAALADQRHTDTQLSLIQLQEVIVKSFSSLVDYLDQKVTRTEVVNQLREIGTPDALRVVDAVNDLHDTLKTHENTDLSEVTAVLREVLAEAQAIPKELPEAPEQKFVDYSSQFESLKGTVEAVTRAVEAQKTVVEAPVVNLPETVVNVDAPDFKPLEKGLEKVERAVQNVELPKTDLTPIEKLLKDTNKTLAKILDKPTGGGGGGGASWPAINEEGIAQPLRLENNALLSSSYSFATKITVSGTDTYVGEAAPGSAQSSAVWRIQKIDNDGNVTWKDGNAAFDNTATDLTTGSFS